MTYDFSIYRRSIIVEAQIRGANDTIGISFILDTGASKTIIDAGVARRLGFDMKCLKDGDKLMTAKGGVNSKILKMPKFSLFGKDLVNFEISIFELPLQITYFADGLIGMDFLLQFNNIKFDFVQKKVVTNDYLN